MNINFFQGSSQHLSQLQSVSGGFLFSFLQKFCLVLHQINVSFIFFACRELLVSHLRKSLDGFIGAHPNHSEKALESTQLYTKSGPNLAPSFLIISSS